MTAYGNEYEFTNSQFGLLSFSQVDFNQTEATKHFWTLNKLKSWKQFL